MLVQSTDCTHVCVLMLCLQYCWFFYQDKVRRSLSSGGQRHVGGHIATQATQQTEKDHLSSVEKMWHDICETVIAMLCKGPEHLHSYACAPPAHSVFTPAAHSCCSLCVQDPNFVPYCSIQDSYTGTVEKSVVGSKAYWCASSSSPHKMHSYFIGPNQVCTGTNVTKSLSPWPKNMDHLSSS